MSLKLIDDVLGIDPLKFHEDAYAAGYGEIRDDRVAYDYGVWRAVMLEGGGDYLPNTYQKDYFKLLMRRIRDAR